MLEAHFIGRLFLLGIAASQPADSKADFLRDLVSLAYCDIRVAYLRFDPVISGTVGNETFLIFIKLSPLLFLKLISIASSSTRR
jgi:hypothetical protein